MRHLSVKYNIMFSETSRLNFRPLVVKIPTPRMLQNDSEHCIGVEELQASPPLELEVLELDKEFDKAEEHLKTEATIAAEESDIEVSHLIVEIKENIEKLLCQENCRFFFLIYLLIRTKYIGDLTC